MGKLFILQIYKGDNGKCPERFLIFLRDENIETHAWRHTYLMGLDLRRFVDFESQHLVQR